MVQLRSVNVGGLQPLTADRPRTRTGIYKYPVEGAVALHALGLAGDKVGNSKHHGGTDQAVYLYSADDYAWWTDALGEACTPGLFGDNLTIDSWWPETRIGDRLHIGEVTLELTAPRIPCATLAARIGDPHFVKRFVQAARPGAYARVIDPGALEAGSSALVVPAAEGNVTIAEVFSLWYRTPRDRESLGRALAAPLAARLRTTFAEWYRAE